MSRASKIVFGSIIGVFALCVLAASVLFILFLFAAVSDTTEPAAQTASATTATPARPLATAKSWQRVGTWSGTGTKTTESFAIRGNEWRIHWQTEGDAVSVFQIFVYDQGGNLVSLAANSQGPGKDVSYVRGRAGNHYLTVNAFGVNWAVIAEEMR